MDKSYGIRLAAVLLLVLGSIWVLLPTILQEDAQSALASKAAGVETGRTEAPVLEVEVAFEGDADLARERVEERLTEKQISFDRVSIGDESLLVRLAIGGTPAQVREALAPQGEVTLRRFADVVVATGLGLEGGPSVDVALPAEGIPPAIAAALDEHGVTWAQLQALGGMAAPAGVDALPGTVSAVDASNPNAVAIGATGVSADGLLAVAVDGSFRGVAWIEGDALVMRTFEDRMSRAAVAGLWQPGGLVVQAVEAAVVEDDQEVVEGEASRIPAWLVGLLPDTRMNLGLDLQGGIDLTLQVELEEAVLSQVSRDATYLQEQAAREGLTLTSVDDDRFEPRVTVTTTDSLSDLQKWFARFMPDYEYVESPTGASHVFAMKEDRQLLVQEQAVEQVLETLRKRVDATGVKEPVIVKKGGGRINVQLPGVVDLQQAVDAIGTTAVLEFHLVDEEFDPTELGRILGAAEATLPPDQYAHDPSLNEWLWKTGRLSESKLLLWEYADSAEGHLRDQPIVVHEKVVLTGSDVNNAGVGFDNNNLPYVSLEFKPQGSRVFCTITTENVQKRFAIVLDGEVKSAPNIRERICGGRASIEMGGAMDPLQESETLALVLRTGSLNAPVSVAEIRTIGASLGQDAINAGILATLIGSVLVVVFMAVWYNRAGMLADVSLVVNVFVQLAVLAMFGATLTLPGIAGIALTIGMAVDANIIIFERIREELALGQHARKAVDAGYEKAFSAIMDGNITTAIAGVVLFSYGTGPIKGFAVTLLVGIGTTLLTALFVSRTFLELMTRNSASKLRI